MRRVYKFRVEFYDVDSLNVVWHGNYVKFLESARCKFLSELGYDYEKMRDEGFSYPVVKMDFKFIQPLFFKDEFEILITLLEIESFLKFSYLITKSGQKICKATTYQACVDMKNMQTCTIAPKTLQNLIKGEL
ncbi:acyl-CoA thioesterase [Campylobacter portucalensis]|nr:thioesterase family protein [Campylobacter portucalensis]